MQFNSFIFILAFLPIVLIVYFLCRKINALAGKICLVVASLVFYGYGGWEFLGILAAGIVVNYLLCLLMRKLKTHRKSVLVLGIVINLALLGYYKYFNFFITNFNVIFKKDLALLQLVMPLAISFYTFQQIAYLVGVYRDDIEGGYEFIDYALYVLYFPKILMGPITEPSFLIPQFNDESKRKPNAENLVRGIKLFCYGLFKKVVIADTFALAVAWGKDNLAAATSMDLIMVMLCYTFQIYFDFSGYCDMATGVSSMLNIELPINFDSPYKSLSIREFWGRWHISLGKFFTKYIYIPLGGSRKGKLRTYLNIMIIFLITGFWHGASWTMIVWGAFHGLLTCFDRATQKVAEKIHPAIRWLGMFAAVCFLRILYIVDTVPQWFDTLGTIFRFESTTVSSGLISTFVLPESKMIFKLLHLDVINTQVRGLSMFIFMLGAFLICMIPQNNIKRKFHNNIVTVIPAVLVLVWSIICLSSESVFIYNNF